MRLFHSQENIVKKALFSPFGAVFFFSVLVYFLFLNYKTIPFMLHMRERSQKAETIYQENVKKTELLNKKISQEETPEGKIRYEKEFFNKLDTDEHLIILHSPEETTAFDDEEYIDQNAVEILIQKTKLWWKNL